MYRQVKPDACGFLLYVYRFGPPPVGLPVIIARFFHLSPRVFIALERDHHQLLVWCVHSWGARE